MHSKRLLGLQLTYLHTSSSKKSRKLGSSGRANDIHSIEAAAYGNSTADDAVVTSSTFEPISKLRVANSTVMLAFLANKVTHLQPVVDPWLRATKLSTQNISNSALDESPIPMYTSAEPVSLLGCVEQMELCNPNIDDGARCTMLRLSHHLNEVVAGMALNEKQMATTARIFYSLARVGVPQTAYSLGGNGLLASSSVQKNLSPGLPSNQWELEVQNWFGTSLTALQLFTVQYVTGYERPDFNKFITPPSPKDEWMCTNQIVQRNDFASFSVLGLAMIFLGCSLIILLSESLSKVLPRIPSKSERKRRNDLEWRAYDILQLQCVATDDIATSLGKPFSLNIPQHSHGRKSSKRLLERLPLVQWWSQWGSSHGHQQQQQQSESPLSTTSLYPSDKNYSRISGDTEVGSPASLQDISLYEKA